MKKWRELLEKRWVAYTLATCSAVLLYVILGNLGAIFSGISKFLNIFSSIFSGVVIAYLMNPVVCYFEERVFHNLKKEKTRHTVSVVAALIVVMALIVLLFLALIPSLVNSMAGLVSNVDTYIHTVQNYLNDISGFAAKFHLDVTKLSSSMNDTIDGILNALPQKFSTILSTSYNVGVGIGNLLIGFILAIYFLLGRNLLLNGIRRLYQLLVSDKTYQIHIRFLKKCNSILLQYVGYDLLDGLIVGCVNAVFMAICRMPYVALISVIVGVTNLLPTFGPIVGAAIGSIILVLNNPLQALIFLIFTVVLQTIDGYILKPKMFGDAFNVPPVWTLVTIIIGGKMFGVLGILLAIPFAAVFTYVYENGILPKLQKRKEEKLEKGRTAS